MSTRSISFVLFLATAASFANAQSVLLPNGTPDPSYPNFWAWFDARNGVNGSGAPAADGTPVSRWDDRTPNARDLTRLDLSPTRHPTAEDNAISCGPAIRFDGDDYVWGSVGDMGSLASPRTIFVVSSIDQADRGYVFDSSTAAGRTALLAGQSAFPGVWNVFWGDNTQGVSNLMVGPTVELLRYQVHAIVIDANAQEYLIDGVSVATETQPAVANLGGLVMGNRFNLALGLTGYIREMLIYDEALSAVNRQAIEAYLLGSHPYGYGASYGSGCAGSGGFVPTLSVEGCPTPGGTFDLAVSEGLGGAPIIYFFGGSRISVPLGPCELAVGGFLFSLSGFVTAGSGPGAGSHSIPITIPGFVGPGSATAQAFVIDPLAAPFGLTFTNGLEMSWL